MIKTIMPQNYTCISNYQKKCAVNYHHRGLWESEVLRKFALQGIIGFINQNSKRYNRLG